MGRNRGKGGGGDWRVTSTSRICYVLYHFFRCGEGVVGDELVSSGQYSVFSVQLSELGHCERSAGVLLRKRPIVCCANDGGPDIGAHSSRFPSLRSPIPGRSRRLPHERPYNHSSRSPRSSVLGPRSQPQAALPGQRSNIERKEAASLNDPRLKPGAGEKQAHPEVGFFYHRLSLQDSPVFGPRSGAKATA